MSPEVALRLSAAIHTPRFVLDPMRGVHAAPFFEPLQDARLYRWISMPRPPSVRMLRDDWSRLESRLSPDGRFAWSTWAVQRRCDGAWLGRVDAEIDADLVATNFGYYVFPPYWGDGIATEAVCAATQALMQRGVRRLVATVTVGNAASVRVLRKAGFAFSRMLPDNDCIGGVPVDDEEYVLDRDAATLG